MTLLRNMTAFIFLQGFDFQLSRFPMSVCNASWVSCDSWYVNYLISYNVPIYARHVWKQTKSNFKMLFTQNCLESTNFHAAKEKLIFKYYKDSGKLKTKKCHLKKFFTLMINQHCAKEIIIEIPSPFQPRRPPSSENKRKWASFKHMPFIMHDTHF